MRRLIHNNKGFTLIELIITVGIIVTLLGISVPAAHAFQQNLNLMKMDTVAKEIYISAQNRLTHLKAAGQLNSSEENNKLEKAFNDFAEARNLKDVMQQKPGDYSGDDTNWEKLYYLGSTDNGLLSYALPSQAVSTLSTENGNYIIEVNPTSGDVYSVFYTEFQSLDVLKNLYNITLYQDRSKANRKSMLVGYYSGHKLSDSVIPKTFQPKITAFNKEELYLEMECKDMLKFSTTFQYITVEITLRDQHDNVKVFSSDNVNSLEGAEELIAASYSTNKLRFTINGDVAKARLLLDSMEGGKGFSEITGLAPGDQIKASASITYSYHGKVISTDVEMQAASEAVFNSLYADDTVLADGHVEVNRVRHLNNLRQEKYLYQLGDLNEGVESIEVIQTGDIDFDASSWDINEWMDQPDVKKNPLTYFTPITNEMMFGRDGAKGVASFNGQGNKIKNFTIGSTTRADNTGLFSAINCDVTKVRMENPKVTGGLSTGCLAGATYGGTVSECGVYLDILDDQGGMDKAVAERVVSGSGRTGGLLGSSANTTIEKSFAAINVNKGSGGVSIGGLVGFASGGRVEKCYSSGEVDGSQWVGGLIGNTSGTDVSGCYSTSDVIASSASGGLIGYAGGGSVKNNNSIGLVRGAENSCGAFADGSSTASFSGNHYLYQNNYNADMNDSGKSGISNASYSDLRDPGNSEANSHPYILSLGVYPFAFIDGINDHYGNWPEEISMDSALIYYECYMDDFGNKEFGYYAKGYTKSESGEDKTNWTLDTLYDQDDLDELEMYVYEDGYALMSTYNLQKIKYSLNDGSSKTAERGSSSTDFKLLENPRKLYFFEDNGRYFTASYLYIYRLPFDVQMTNRNINAKFYDKIKIIGYAKGNSSEAVFSNYTYYYNPHFSKNAIQMYDTGGSRPNDPSEIEVRTARQLNILGRYPYYWNMTNTSNSFQFKFKQGLSLDFGKYTDEYCGKQYDMMDTSEENIYRNRPIGITGADQRRDETGTTFVGKPFGNKYDGDNYEIIDYRVETYTGTGEEFRFTGLFGQVSHNGSLANIHMVASDPENMSGYVISHCNAKQGTISTGGLCGLLFINAKGVVVSITNCSISGYEVRHELDDNASANVDMAIGGLIGIACGTSVDKCSAVNKITSLTVENGNGKYFSVGGLIGSKQNGTLTNSYAGGQVKLNAKSIKAGSGIGGLTGAYVATSENNGTELTVAKDVKPDYCYSFTELLPCDDGYATTYTTYGCVGSGYGKKPSTGNIDNCFYLDSSLGIVPSVTGGFAKTYEELESLEDWGGFVTGGLYPETSFNWSEALCEETYPFPAVVNAYKFGETTLVHYGDWPLREIESGGEFVQDEMEMTIDEEVSEEEAQDEEIPGEAIELPDEEPLLTEEQEHENEE